MANSFPTASTVIHRLGKLGIEALPAWQFSDIPGYYVGNGIVHTFGPTIQVQGDNKEWLTRKLAELLEENNWNVEQTKPTILRINSIPR